MKRLMGPYLILLIVVLMACYQAINLFHLPRPVVLSATVTKSNEDRILSLEKRVANLERYTGMVKPTSTGKTKETFVSLMGGTANGADWTKISGSDFVLDQSLYGNVTEVSWQGWVDGGYGYVRLYDNTNKRAVDGSEMMISSGEKASFYSKPLSIWRGQNQYWIEVRSIAGDVSVSLPRLKILTK